MITTMILIVGMGLSLMALERIRPARTLPHVKGWWTRVIVINIFQATIVIVGGYTWERWLASARLLQISDHLPTWAAGLLAYFVITFVYYWWHRARHDVPILWLSMHQIHHSPSRIETITSFFKHPLEIFMNSIIITVVVFGILGVNQTAGQIVTVLTCYAEYFYHMNLKTPHWVGYFIQRPEMHRFHHQLGRHYNNFADLPLWDRMFGTYYNPTTEETQCGFLPDREAKFWTMLGFKDVNQPIKKRAPSAN